MCVANITSFCITDVNDFWDLLIIGESLPGKNRKSKYGKPHPESAAEVLTAEEAEFEARKPAAKRPGDLVMSTMVFGLGPR